MVSDRDTENENNNKFDLKMISVTPKPQDLEFYLEQKGELGMISFKGCLDHKVRRLTLVGRPSYLIKSFYLINYLFV